MMTMIVILLFLLYTSVFTQVCRTVYCNKGGSGGGGGVNVRKITHCCSISKTIHCDCKRDPICWCMR